jgi:hypothetical protein
MILVARTDGANLARLIYQKQQVLASTTKCLQSDPSTPIHTATFLVEKEQDLNARKATIQINVLRVTSNLK